MQLRSRIRQTGVSLGGLIILLFLIGMGAVLALKVVPTVTEYLGIKHAIASAKASSTTIAQARATFDKQADVGYIDSISSKDLDIVKNGGDIDISFAYQKKIPLVGPVSLLIDYAGSTSKDLAPKPAP
ncbi:MAG TPA: DUF4845 domain-containing protein [Oxalobacteraceae bacterium]|nr:DUF4845 domain-containing protein [Oxalobacteraceae bacterium]HCN88507.1 DUF4845 domain-containing protein [Oxalobacteraceae bacterium]